MANTRKTWKQRREQQRRENFIGRREHLREFSDDFTSAEPQYMVFSVTGEGGVGKSTLLAQYANLAAAAGALVVTCDDRHTTPAQAMGHIAAELAKLGITHDKFDERYKKYRELRDEIESDPKAPRGAMDLLARGVTDLAIKSGRRIPGVGVLLEGA